MLKPWLETLPLVAILRGIHPDEAVDVGDALVTAGFCMLEVPLNSPQPMLSIRRLADAFGTRALVGAGTVRTPSQVWQVAAAGGRLIVMPHADVTIIATARRMGLACTPGVATPTEAFAALDAGADGLKLFPAGQFTPKVLTAWRSVLPPGVPILPVGGIDVDNLAAWRAAGADGLGIGSALYRPGMDAQAVASRARTLIQAWNTPS